MQKKRSFHYTANVGNLKKKDPYIHQIQLMKPNLCSLKQSCPLFFHSPNSASHQKSTQKVNDYGK